MTDNALDEVEEWYRKKIEEEKKNRHPILEFLVAMFFTMGFLSFFSLLGILIAVR